MFRKFHPETTIAMANLSTFYKQKVAGMLLGEEYSVPSTIYLALHTGDPTSGGGNEVTGTGYARVAIVTATDLSAATSGGLKKNANALTFPAAGSGGWGTVTHYSIKTASTSGEILFYGTITSKTIAQYDTISVPANSLVLTVA
jgi:hypothetical protein